MELHEARSPQPQRAACIYRRLLDAGPIFYEVARSIGLIEDLQTAYHNPVLVNQMLSLSFHWLSTADNVARRYSLFTRNHVLPFMGKMDGEFLASFYSGLSGMQSELYKLHLRCSDHHYALSPKVHPKNKLYILQI